MIQIYVLCRAGGKSDFEEMRGKRQWQKPFQKGRGALLGGFFVPTNNNKDLNRSIVAIKYQGWLDSSDLTVDAWYKSCAESLLKAEGLDAGPKAVPKLEPTPPHLQSVHDDHFLHHEWDLLEHRYHLPQPKDRQIKLHG